ncbi:response regulator [Methanobacterium sp. MBAC-LM]|uniref:response regulator n=1 Tax=Methanobacterium sp. MBAC-LM TaxID=3412034 RepID=UPI003C731977
MNIGEDKKKFSILIIEDNPADIRMMQEIFKESNTKTNIHVAYNGIEALEFLNKKEKHQNQLKPNLILLDLNIPLIDGFEVLKEIKTNNKLKDIPVIILTTSNTKENFSKAQEFEANCFITKPLDYDEYTLLLQHIEECWFKTKPSHHI